MFSLLNCMFPLLNCMFPLLNCMFPLLNCMFPLLSCMFSLLSCMFPQHAAQAAEHRTQAAEQTTQNAEHTTQTPQRPSLNCHTTTTNAWENNTQPSTALKVCLASEPPSRTLAKHSRRVLRTRAQPELSRWMLVTPAQPRRNLANALEVADFFGDRQRQFNFREGYIYHNDNGKQGWYFALWVDDAKAICVGGEDVVLPRCVAHVSLLKAPFQSEALALDFAQRLSKQLNLLKKKQAVDHFQGCGGPPIDENVREHYAWFWLDFQCGLYRTCHQLVKGVLGEMHMPWFVRRHTKLSFHVSFDTSRLSSPAPMLATEESDTSQASSPTPTSAIEERGQYIGGIYVRDRRPTIQKQIYYIIFRGGVAVFGGDPRDSMCVCVCVWPTGGFGAGN